LELEREKKTNGRPAQRSKNSVLLSRQFASLRTNGIINVHGMNPTRRTTRK
jgi:hypothetical protein